MGGGGGGVGCQMGDGVGWGGSEASAAVPAGSDAAPKQLTRGELMEKVV